MAMFTREKAERIAESCRLYLAAHEARNADHEWMTLREQSTLAMLRYEIDALRRESAPATAGTAS